MATSGVPTRYVALSLRLSLFLMGKVEKVFHEGLISPIPDRHSNYLKVYQSPNGEVTIRFRNLKIVLHSREEIEEWKNGMRIALENLRKGDFFKNDI